MRQPERWVPVAGYEDRYEVSDAGRIRSLATGLLRKTSPSRGYERIALYRDGAHVNRFVHQVVAASFLGPRPDGMEVCHNNGNGLDNRLTNLRYDTHSANARDMVRHGRHHRAKRDRCEHGHEFTPENTRIRSDNGQSGRRCIQCERERGRRRWRGSGSIKQSKK